MPDGGLVVLLFTDVVGSTELLSRAGDERAQRILRAHHELLTEAVASHGGHEVKWLGDGLMVAFPSAAQAVRCAIAIQVASRRPVGAERLEVRVGLNAGEALRDEADYFGTPVVVARRLCDGAGAGQILCTDIVKGLLTGRQAFSFNDIGKLDLKGIDQPVGAFDVTYERERRGRLTLRSPFVGRTSELTDLGAHFADAMAGRGGLVMLVGEPGIGKTRTADELADRARAAGATVLWGRCYEGEWSPPYCPFAEAIDGFARAADPSELVADLGYGAAPIAQIARALSDVFPDLASPERLEPDEERFRLLDAVSQFLIALSRRAPVVLVLDDLHWADRGSIGMLRHVARFAGRHRLLLVGAYRDVELDRTHPLSDALATLRRETDYSRVNLKGLHTREIGELLSSLAERDVPEALTKAIADETDGNPFFIREVLLHLIEEGRIHQDADGRWTADVALRDMRIPESVREVIGRRLRRLSRNANELLSVASAFEGEFRFDVAAGVAELDERNALDAIDEALDAQILQPGASVDTYSFTHAHFRHTLFSELNPSRQVRLHRRLAEALEAAYPDPAPVQSAELAYQFHRSAVLPGAERGVEHALRAAEHAAASWARNEVVAFMQMAVELLPEGDIRRARLQGWLGIALGRAFQRDQAVEVAEEAADLIAAAEGTYAAAKYLAEATMVVGLGRGGWALAKRGLEFFGDRPHDDVWAQLTNFDLRRRDFEDPEFPGIELESEERREVGRLLGSPLQSGDVAGRAAVIENLAEVLATRALTDPVDFPREASVGATRAFWTGELRTAADGLDGFETWGLTRGMIPQVALNLAHASRCRTALGELGAARERLERALVMLDRAGNEAYIALQVNAARDELAMAVDEDWPSILAVFAPGSGITLEPANRWAFAAVIAASARALARVERSDEAVDLLSHLVVPLERAAGWSTNYPRIACDAAEVLWLTQRTDHIEVIERNVRTKVVEPDFRYCMMDGRLALARLCALQARYDEASQWFADSRRVLEEQEARPLRAIADYDEALMYARRNEPGDADLARPLLDAAVGQFEDIGMTGWLRRAAELGGRIV